MNSSNYKTPPILEAVIELRFSSSADRKKLTKLIHKLRQQYDNFEESEQRTYSFRFELHEEAIADKKDVEPVYHLSTMDMSSMTIIKPKSILVSQKAPYKGWEQFYERFNQDWRLWREYVGFIDIARVGTRFVNRLDIPIQIPETRYEDYINLYPQAPSILEPNVAHKINIVAPEKDAGALIHVRSETKPSPVPDHLAVYLDIDIYKEFNSPQSDQAIHDLISAFRIVKNKVFEACVTDKARELFRK